MELEEFVNICYKLHNVEGIDRYCEYMGFGTKRRNRITKKNQYAYLKYSCCGRDFQLVEEIGLLKFQYSFKPNPSYRELSCSNGWCRSSIQIIENEVIHTQSGRKQIVTISEFFEDGMRQTITVDNAVVLIKNYVRVDKA